MIEREHPSLSINAQCKLLDLCRSSLYYKPVDQESDLNLVLMQELDRQYMKTPFYGTQKMTRHLRSLGHEVNRKRVSRLMKLMGLHRTAEADDLSQA